MPSDFELGMNATNEGIHSPEPSIIPLPFIGDKKTDLEASPAPAINILNTGQPDQAQQSGPKSRFKPRTKKIMRFGVFLAGVGILLLGRTSVPDNDVPNVKDKVLEALEFANDFINEKGHENLRSAFQALCSFLVDLVFVITFGFWVSRGNSSRLPMTLAVFYVIRAIIQTLWYSPYPKGFYWDDPGFPSLVVPYGRGSDFFFSGHSGFLIICAKEWHRIGNKIIRNFVLAVAVYTILVLLVYRIHYFIDVFTGVFFAEYCWDKMDLFRRPVDSFIAKVLQKTWDIVSNKSKKKKESLKKEDGNKRIDLGEIKVDLEKKKADLGA